MTNAPGDRTRASGRPGRCHEYVSIWLWDYFTNYFWMTASTSRAESTRYSSPLCLISVPPYLL